mgnify:CR=1 FL=1
MMIDDELLKRPIRSFFTILLHRFPRSLDTFLICSLSYGCLTIILTIIHMSSNSIKIRYWSFDKSVFNLFILKA